MPETRTAGAVAKTTVFVTRPGGETTETSRVPTTTTASLIPSSGTPKASEEDPYRTWIVLGSGLGGLLVILLLVCVGRAFWRSRKSIRANETRLEEQHAQRQLVNEMYPTRSTPTRSAPSLDQAEVPQNDHGGLFDNHLRPVYSYPELVDRHGGQAAAYAAQPEYHGGQQLNIFGRLVNDHRVGGPVNDHRELAELPGEVPVELPAHSYVRHARATHNNTT